MNDSLNELLDNAPCGFFSFTDDGSIVIMNQTLLELLGYELGELTEQPIKSILPIASQIFYQTHFFPLLKMQGKAKEIYFSLKSKQGVSIPMLINAVRREKADYFVNDCVVIPIHQRIQYEDELLQAKKIAEAALNAQKEAEKALRQEYQRSVLLAEITQQIRKSLDLSEIFSVSSQEIRRFLQSDRVGIYQFHADSNFESGEFVAESVGEGFDSLMKIKIDDHCFGERYATDYQHGKIQALEDIDKVELAKCYRDILVQFQIRANLIVPLLANEKSWGLLCIHQCSAPRIWQTFEIDLVKQIADQLAIAIQQADLFQKLQQELVERQQAQTLLIETNADLADATRRLEKLVNTDALTQIANRRCFDEKLAQKWLCLRREQQNLSLLLFDVDYFKRYNDHYGHQQGDDCLIQLAQSVQKVIHRPADLLARYGGEEFVVILPNTFPQGAIAIAEKIHQAIKKLNIPHQTSEVGDHVTVSIGIANLIPSLEQSFEILIHQADKALYLAKNRGRNQSAVFDS